jgi:uncharacterized protein YlxP (DUF503 family)
MVIGVCTIELYLPENHSLKGKRHVVKGVKEKLKSRFNVSVAEIDHLDVWQRATIGAIMLNTDHVYVDQELRKMVNFLESSQYAPYLFDYSIEFL